MLLVFKGVCMFPVEPKQLASEQEVTFELCTCRYLRHEGELPVLLVALNQRYLQISQAQGDVTCITCSTKSTLPADISGMKVIYLYHL